MFPNWIRWLGYRRTFTKVSRPMTPAESKAFDKVFDSMDQTFKAMNEFFDVARSAGVSSQPRPGTIHEGTKGSNNDG